MSAPPDLRSIAEIAPLLQGGTLSPVDLVRGCLARIDARPELNAFITVMRERALEDARRRGGGDRRRPLPRPPARRSGVGEGSVRRRGNTDDGGVGAAAALSPRGRAGRHAAARGRSHPHRQDQSSRVRLRHDQRGVGVRARAASARSVAVAGRIERRRRRRARRGHVLRIGGHRHGRLRPDSVGGVRDGRAQADPERAVVRRGRRAQRHARSRRTDGADRCGRGRACSRRCRATRRAGAPPPFSTRRSRAARGRTARVRCSGGVFLGAARSRACARRWRERSTRSAGAGHDVRTVAIEHAARTADVYLHIVLPEASWYHAATHRHRGRSLLPRRTAAARDGPIHPRRGLRAGDVPAEAC